MSDSETALLGALLSGYDPADITAVVNERDFDQPAHALIFATILRVAASSKTGKADVTQVRFALGDEAKLIPQGPTYLVDLMQACPLPFNAPVYAEQVATEAGRRRLRDTGMRLMQLAESDCDPATARADAAGYLTDDRVDTAELVTLGEVMPQVIDIAEKGLTRGVASPWPDLDRLTRGFFPGRLYVVGARPGVGKSLIGSNCATKVARTGDAVLVASMEMSSVEWTQRSAAAASGVELSKFESGGLTEQDWTRVHDATPAISALPIFVDDRETQTLATIRTGARRVARTHRLGMIIVDYLQMLSPADRKVPRHEQVGEMSRSLKKLSREFEVPVIALAQVNRAAVSRKDGRPTLADLRESGGIEADADVVILLHTDEEDAPHLVEAIVAKGRNIGKGMALLQKQGHLARIVSNANGAWRTKEETA